MKLAIKYGVFAILSIGVNLLFQSVSLRMYAGFLSLYIAMAVGTLLGLITKYVLDKKYIFYHTPKDKKDDAKKFMIYSLMGVLTTMIFWGTEILFDSLFVSAYAKYWGATLGLSVGYVIKYFLDKKFVFLDGKVAP